MTELKVRVASYNLLSPELCKPSYFSHCPTPDSTSPKKRLERVLKKLDEETAENSIICLQEVSRSWLGNVHQYFHNKSYTYIHSEYGYAFNGYMGVGIAYPNQVFDLEECKVNRISETKSGGFKAPVDPAATNSSQRGTLTTVQSWLSPMTKLLSRLFSPVFGTARSAPVFDLWRDVERRQNSMVMLRLSHKDSTILEEQKRPKFCVATYHMPCAFRTPPVIAVHCSLVAQRLQKTCKGDPYILAGDFNIKPHSSMYELLTQGKCLSDESKAEAYPKEPAFEGDKWDIEFQPPLKSAYFEANGTEPNFTNLARTAQSGDESFIDTLDYIFFKDQSADKKTTLMVESVAPLPHRDAYKDIKSFPTREEPSDHLKIAAVFKLKTT